MHWCRHIRAGVFLLQSICKSKVVQGQEARRTWCFASVMDLVKDRMLDELGLSRIKVVVPDVTVGAGIPKKDASKCMPVQLGRALS